MLYKTKLEINIEEFKSKDEVKFSEVQDLNESIYKYNNKLKHIDKFSVILLLIVIIFIASILGVFVLGMNKEFVILIGSISIFSAGFWGIVDEEGVDNSLL